jgi:chromosome segregation ATPase
MSNQDDLVDLQEQRTQFEDQILEADKKLRGLETTIKLRRKELRQVNLDKEEALSALAISRKDTERAIAGLQEDKKRIVKEIAERKSYLLEQEELITTTIHDWNDQLANIKAEAAKAESDRTTMLKDIVRHEQQRDEIVLENEKLGKKLAELNYMYEERVRDYKEKLRLLSIEEKDQARYIQEMETRLEARLKDVEKREKTIKVTEIVQARANEEIRQKRRKLQFDYNLAGETLE